MNCLLDLIHVIIHDDKYLLIIIPDIELFNVNIFEFDNRPVDLLEIIVKESHLETVIKRGELLHNLLVSFFSQRVAGDSRPCLIGENEPFVESHLESTDNG